MSDAYSLYRQGLDALAAGHADEAIAPLERAKKLVAGAERIRVMVRVDDAGHVTERHLGTA